MVHMVQKLEELNVFCTDDTEWQSRPQCLQKEFSVCQAVRSAFKPEFCESFDCTGISPISLINIAPVIEPEVFVFPAELAFLKEERYALDQQ